MVKKCVICILCLLSLFFFTHCVKGEVKTKTEWSKEVVWLNSKEGITDEVLPPWTPIEVEKEKNGKSLIVKVWGRAYQFNNSAFPDSIETKGNSILSKPIQIIARVDGKTVSWQWNSPEIDKQIPSIVCFNQDASGKGLSLSTKTQIEYDGMIRMDWKIIPQRSLRLEELTFEIPISAKYAKYVYTPGYTGKVGFIPKDRGVGAFEPMIWFGDEDVGLEWFCESERDWYNTKPTRRIEILPQNDMVMLRLHLVDKVLHLKPGVRVHHESGIPIMQSPDEVVELSYTFGIQATPVKPVIKDVWDYRIEHMGAGTFTTGTTVGSGDRFNISEAALDALFKSGVRTLAIHEHWTDIYSSTTTTYDETLKPIYDNALKKLVKDCHKYGIQIILYFGMLMSDIEPAWPLFNEKCIVIPRHVWDLNGWPAPPMLPQKPANVCWRSVWQDYLVDGLDKMMKEYDIDGVYLDSTALVWGGCENTLHGCGYMDSKGNVIRTYAIFPNRQIMKRIYAVVKKHKPDGQVNLHNSLEMLAPAMSWATSYWNGEHLGDRMSQLGISKDAPLLERLPLDQFRTEFMGHQWGVPAEFLHYGVSSNIKEVFILSLLHDVPVRHSGIESPVWKIFDEFGRKQAEWLPYWKNSEYVTIKPDNVDVYVSLYQHPQNGVLAVVCNLGKEKTEVKIYLNLQKLKLTGQLSAYNVLSNKPVGITDGIFELKLPSSEFRIIWLKET